MKKTISLVLSVLLLFNIGICSVQAVNSEATAEISKVSALPGEKVEVFISLVCDGGIKTLSFIDFIYDTTVLTLVESECAWLVEGKIKDIDLDNNVSVITFSDNTVINGNVLKLVFEVSANANVGSFPVSCDVIGTRMICGVETKIDVSISVGEITVTGSVSAEISKVSAVPGEKVEVFISLACDEGIKTLSFVDFTYDASVLSIVKSECVWLVDGKIKDIDLINNVSVITFADNTVINGNVLKLVFEVSENAEAGASSVSCDVIGTRMIGGVETKIDVSISAGEIIVEREPEEQYKIILHTFDEDEWDSVVIEETFVEGTGYELPSNIQITDECDQTAVCIDVTNGGLYAEGETYTVNANAEFYLLGDVSGDGMIDSSDVSLLRQFIMESITVDEVVNGDVEFIWQVANVSGYEPSFDLTQDEDEEWYDYYDSDDANTLRRFVLGFEVEVG